MGSSAQWTFSLTSGMLKLFILSNLAGWDGQMLAIVINYHLLRVFIYSFYSCVCSQSLSHVQLFVTLWTLAHQTPLSVIFSRQEYWNGMTSLSPGDLPNPGIEPTSPTRQVNSFLLRHQGSQRAQNSKLILKKLNKVENITLELSRLILKQ